jgi:glycosyltransferase involved in cell wall biosynthesis
MKVCILSHSFSPAQGAAELYMGNLAEELAKNGLEVVVITNAYDAALPTFEEHGNLKIYRFSNRFPPAFQNYGFMLGLGPVLKKVHEKERFDLLHTEHVFPMPSAGKFAKKNKIPHIVVIEGISRVSPYSKLVHLTHKFILPRAHFDILVAWSRFLVEEFFKKWGMSEDKIRIIPGALDLNKFNPNIDGSKVRGDLLDPDTEKLIFTVTPMNHSNFIGLAYIVKAMQDVVRENKTCKLIIGGDGRRKKDAEKLVRDMGLQQHVKFIGWIQQERIPEYYAASDIVVNSTVYRHAGSVKVLESLSSGKPNVLCNIESLPGEDSFPTKDIAMLVKPKDAHDMARGILEVLNDEERGKRLGSNAWNFIMDTFSIENIARDYKKVYEELVK